jgi:hypothetical protein
MRHSPAEPALKRVLPWLAAEQHDVYNAYQQTQGPSGEKQMLRAKWLASFIGHQPGKALYIGLYRVMGYRTLTYDEYWRVPAYQEMRQWGITGLTRSRGSCLWFDLELNSFYNHWKGKLVVDWPGGERSWSRWSNRNRLEICAVHEDSLLDPPVPDWSALNLGWADLSVLPTRLRNALSEWRGIYYIFDEATGKGYVGSAYGKENILGRWKNYAANGHGGNAQLRRLDPRMFRFSILQRVSPDMEPAEVIDIENSWKSRLHTRIHGLNDN